MLHVKNEATGEWRFNVGAGYDYPPWTQNPAGADLEYAKYIRRASLSAEVRTLIYTRYDAPEQATLTYMKGEADRLGLANRSAYINAIWNWISDNMLTTYYGSKGAVDAAADVASVNAAMSDYTASLAADPLHTIQGALAIPD